MKKRNEQKRAAAGQPGKPPQGGNFALHEHIGGQLKAMFDAVVEEPVPEKLRKLLEELERKQQE